MLERLMVGSIDADRQGVPAEFTDLLGGCF
jgi:hypothetical protein